MAANSAAGSTAAEAKKYFERHAVQPLLTEMLVSLGRKMPEEPLDYMINYLQDVKAKGGISKAAPASANGAQASGHGASDDNGPSSPATREAAGGDTVSSLPGSPRAESPKPHAPPAGGLMVPKPYARNRRASVFSEGVTPEKDSSWKPPVHEKVEDDSEFIRKSLSRSVLLKDLEPEEIELMTGAMFQKHFQPGETIIKQGEDGDLWYILQDGVCECYVQGPPIGPDDAKGAFPQYGKLVFTYNHGMAFGELALMYNAPRAATIVAVGGPVKCWALDRTTFKRVLAASATKQRNVQMEFIDKVEMFASLSRFEKLRLLEALKPCHFDPEDRIVQEGDPGHEFYIIEEGEVKCVKMDEETGDETECFRRLGPGDYFGELALLTQKPRAVSIDAVTAVKCHSLEHDAFERLQGPLTEVLKRNADQYAKWATKAGLDQTVRSTTTATAAEEEEESDQDGSPAAASPVKQRQRTRRANVIGDSAEDYADWVPPTFAKAPEDAAFIHAVVSKSVLFKHLSEPEISVIVAAMESCSFEANTPIITQGEDGDRYYVLQQGRCECFVKKPGQQTTGHGDLVFTYNPGQAFGELALMYNAPRAATIVAVGGPAKCWALDRKTFKKVLVSEETRVRDAQLEFVSKVPLFAEFNKFERYRVLEAMKAKSFKAGDAIVTQGEPGHEFFMISEGEAKCMKWDDESKTSQHECFRRLQAGDYFGELALLSKKPRAVSVIAVNDVSCYVLDEDDFQRLLGPLDKILMRNSEAYAVWMQQAGLAKNKA